MPMIIPDAPDAALAALDKALPRFVAVATAPVVEAPAVADTAFRARVSAKPSILARASGIAHGVEDFVARRRIADDGDAKVVRSKDKVVRAKTEAHRPLAAQVTVMGLTDLKARKSPRKVQPSVWTHFLSEGPDGAQAVADVDAKTFKFTQVVQGAGIADASRRIAALQASEAKSAKASELAMLRVPALNLTAVWLKGAAGEADDVVIPNEGPIAPLVPGKRYPLAEFQEIAAKMADERLKMDRGDAGG